MLGTIREIENNFVFVDLNVDLSKQASLLNIHVVFEYATDKIVGEIISCTKTTLKITIVGEIKNNVFLPGINKKPSFASIVRIVTMPELELILGSQGGDASTLKLGYSNIYENYQINVSMNDFFSNHFAILGNSEFRCCL